MSAICTEVPVDRDPQPWVDPCPGCGSDECGDWGLCDLPSGAEWAQAVADCEAQTVDAEFVRLAVAQINEQWGTTGSHLDRDAVAELTLALDRRGAWVGHDEAAALLKNGATFEEVAKASSVPVAMLIGKFTQFRSAPVADVLRSEGLLRSGMSGRAAARHTGLSHQQVCRIAEAIGIELSRDGRKYTSEMVRQGWTMRLDGAQYKDIAKALELKDANAAAGMLRRNACPDDLADSVRLVESVAS